jgi:hypothetical protein
MLTSFAFEGVVSFAERVLVKLKELSESVDREMSLGVFFLIHDGG